MQIQGTSWVVKSVKITLFIVLNIDLWMLTLFSFFFFFFFLFGYSSFIYFYIFIWIWEVGFSQMRWLTSTLHAIKSTNSFFKIFFLLIIGQMMGDASLEKCLVKQLCLIYYKCFRFYLELCCSIFLKYLKDKFKDRCCNIYP